MLVDGDKAILEACQERLEVQGIRSVEKEFVQVLFEDYSTEGLQAKDISHSAAPDKGDD